MKKHELLKYAYDNYKEGVEFKSVYHGKILVSTGIFYISDEDKNDSAAIRCVIEDIAHAVYCFDRKEWAEIIPEKPASILDGKVAIYCLNYREYLIVQKYNKSFNRNTNIPVNASYYENKPIYVTLTDQVLTYSTIEGNKPDNEGYKVIPFTDFAKEAGITVPVFIMTSEDGVDLYEGDRIVTVNIEEKRIGNHDWKARKKVVEEKKDKYKYFASLTSAESWIAEQNKPKEILVLMDAPGNKSIVCHSLVQFWSEDNMCFCLNKKEMDAVVKAYQSLNHD